MWVLWAYLLLRYAQFLGTQEELGIRKSFYDHMNVLLREKMVDIGTKTVPEWRGNFGEVGYERLVRRRFTWSQKLWQYDPKVGGQVEIGSLTMPSWIVLWSISRAAFFVALATPKGTEHVLPLLLAAAAPLVALLR
jgi:hypothetical protein